MSCVAKKASKNFSIDPDLMTRTMAYVKERRQRVSASEVAQAGLIAFFDCNPKQRQLLVNRGRDYDLEMKQLEARAGTTADADADHKSAGPLGRKGEKGTRRSKMAERKR